MKREIRNEESFWWDHRALQDLTDTSLTMCVPDCVTRGLIWITANDDIVIFRGPIDNTTSNKFTWDLQDLVESPSLWNAKVVVAVAKEKLGLGPSPGSLPWGLGLDSKSPINTCWIEDCVYQGSCQPRNGVASPRSTISMASTSPEKG